MATENPNDDQVEVPTRSEIIQLRTDKARDGLLTDIEKWADSLAQSDPVITFHINEFNKLCRGILIQLDNEFKRSADDVHFFKLQVVGSLTTQWLLLREVASLRLPGSPYQGALQGLDQQAALYYQAILNALPPSVHTYISANPPLISLDRSAEFFLFTNQSQLPPAIITRVHL